MKRLIWPLILFGLFLARFNLAVQSQRNLDKYVGREIKLTGNISSQIKLQDNYQLFNLGRIQVKAPLYPQYNYGDRVVISGSLQSKVINPYLVRFSLSYPRITRLEAGRNIFIGFKKFLEVNLRQRLPEPESVLTAGIVLGSQSGMSREFWETLRQTGTLHLVVASGYNVSIVLGATVGLLAGWLKRPRAIGIGIMAVAGYSFMAGGEAPIIRAAIMGSLAYLAQALGRPAQSLRLLIIAAAVMIFINPLMIFDVGFQLSFLATLGLIVLCPRLSFVPGGFRETLAAQIFVWPLLYFVFGQINPWSIVINGLAIPLVPYIMFLGGLLALTGWPILGYLAYLPTHLLVKIIYAF